MGLALLCGGDVWLEPDGLLASDSASVRIPNRVHGVELARVVSSLNANVTSQNVDPSGGIR
jgi:hypothetical protein